MRGFDRLGNTSHPLQLTCVKTNLGGRPKLLVMKSDDPNMLNAVHEEPHLPQEVVLELLHCQLRNNIAPLALEIDCAAMRTWGEEQMLERFRYQNLVRELRAWNHYLNRRPISRILINEPFCLMDAPSLTELTHAIGQNLKLISGNHVEHTATLAIADITRQNIALLKGLGFNHIEIRVPVDFDIQQLRQVKQTLLEFKIAYVSLQLDFGSERDAFSMQLMELLSFVEPATLAFHRSIKDPLARIAGEGLTALLMQFGYFLHEDNTIMRFNSPLRSRPTDCVRLGPGAASRFGAMRTVNFATAPAYHARVQTNGLPVATCR